MTSSAPRRSVRVAGAAALTALALAAAPPAHAIARTFVASFGSDGNPCTLAAPCRGFAAALVQTDAGGEIVVLDSAGYGAVTIGKSVAITVPAGIYAGISVLAGDGVTVAGAGVNVSLSNLTINGQGGVHGIRFVQGARLDVVGCRIVGMGGDGIRVEGAGSVNVRDTAIRGSAQNGVRIGAAATATIVRSRIQSSGADGIGLGSGAVGSATRTLVFDNDNFGVSVSQPTAGTARIALDDVAVSDNSATGVSADATGASAVAQVEVTRSLLARNLHGVFALSGSGGTATVAVTASDVVENQQAGLTTSTSGGTSVARASRNGVFRNAVAGFLPGLGSQLYSSRQNDVRDNDLGDDFGSLTDSLM